MTARMKLASTLLAIALVFSPTAWSQEAPAAGSTSTHPSVDSYKQSPERYFRLTFRVLELSPEGKIINSRSYTDTVPSGTKSELTSSIRTKDTVPVGCANSGNPPDCPPSTSLNIGTDIDVRRIEIVDQTLHLYVNAQISTLSFKPPASAKFPLTRSAAWTSFVTIPINKPTIIFSSDNSADRGKTEMELTAVPIGQ